MPSGSSEVALVVVEHAAHRAAAEYAAPEARALLEPEGHGRDACGAADRRRRIASAASSASEHAERAVEAPAVGRRVEVRAAPDLGQIGLAPEQPARRGCRPASNVDVEPAPRASSRPRARRRAARRRPSPGRFVPAARPISKSVSSRSSTRSGAPLRGREAGRPRSGVVQPAHGPEYVRDGRWHADGVPRGRRRASTTSAATGRTSGAQP